MTFRWPNSRGVQRASRGEVSLRQEKGWQDLCLTCEVQGNRVTRLIWQPLPGANKPQ